MSETSSSSSRTPCWGLVCKLWSFDLHPLPYLNKSINKFFILSRKKTHPKLNSWPYTSILLTFPSPVLTSTSTAYTSCTSNSAFSWSFLQIPHNEVSYWSKTTHRPLYAPADRTHFCWSDGFWMIVFSPSITCCLSWWESMPADIEKLKWVKWPKITSRNRNQRVFTNTHPQWGSTWMTLQSCSRLPWPACSDEKQTAVIMRRGLNGYLVTQIWSVGELYLVSWLDEAESGFSTEVSCLNDVRLTSCQWVVLQRHERQVKDLKTYWDYWRKSSIWLLQGGCIPHTLVTPTMKLWATFEMKPSTCTPRSLHTNRRWLNFGLVYVFSAFFPTLP